MHIFIVKALWFLIIVLIIMAVFKFVHSIIEAKLVYLKDTDIDTELKEFQETHAIAKRVDSAVHKNEHNVSKEFELKCIEEPLYYLKNKDIPAILARYKNILSGAELDPGFKHIPSSHIDEKFNPDYLKYFENQLKSYKSSNEGGRYKEQIDYINSKLKDIKSKFTEEDMRNNFKSTLKDMGLPESCLDDYIINDTKMNSYNEKDWEVFCKSIKKYLKKYSEEDVIFFSTLINDINIISDPYSIETFSVLYNKGIPGIIILPILFGDLDISEAEMVAQIHEEEGCGWEDALKKYFRLKDVVTNTQDLRNFYRNQIE